MSVIAYYRQSSDSQLLFASEMPVEKSKNTLEPRIARRHPMSANCSSTHIEGVSACGAMNNAVSDRTDHTIQR